MSLEDNKSGGWVCELPAIRRPSLRRHPLARRRRRFLPRAGHKTQRRRQGCFLSASQRAR